MAFILKFLSREFLAAAIPLVVGLLRFAGVLGPDVSDEAISNSVIAVADAFTTILVTVVPAVVFIYMRVRQKIAQG